MPSVNKVILLGRLGRDPESRETSSGSIVTTISLATSVNRTDRDGEKQEITTWHEVRFFGRTAEVAREYLKKGRLCYVEGRLDLQKWEGSDGEEKSRMVVLANNLQLLGGRGEGESDSDNSSSADDYRAASGGGKAKASASRKQNLDDFEDDIPF